MSEDTAHVAACAAIVIVSECVDFASIERIVIAVSEGELAHYSTTAAVANRGTVRFKRTVIPAEAAVVHVTK